MTIFPISHTSISRRPADRPRRLAFMLDLLQSTRIASNEEAQGLRRWGARCPQLAVRGGSDELLHGRARHGGQNRALLCK